MVFCCVADCQNRTFDRVPNSCEFSFHRIPPDKKLEKIWLKLARRPDEKDQNKINKLKMCSEHFLPTDYNYPYGPGSSSRRLKPDAIPSVFPARSRQVTPSDLKRAERAQKRKNAPPLPPPSPPTCLLCCGQPTTSFPAGFDREFFEEVLLPKFLYIPNANPGLRFILFNSGFCINCSELLGEVVNTLKGIDELQKRLFEVRDEFDANLVRGLESGMRKKDRYFEARNKLANALKIRVKGQSEAVEVKKEFEDTFQDSGGGEPDLGSLETPKSTQIKVSKLFTTPPPPPKGSHPTAEPRNSSIGAQTSRISSGSVPKMKKLLILKKSNKNPANYSIPLRIIERFGIQEKPIPAPAPPPPPVILQTFTTSPTPSGSTPNFKTFLISKTGENVEDILSSLPPIPALIRDRSAPNFMGSFAASLSSKFPCPTCGEVNDSKLSLWRHQISHQGRDWRCPVPGCEEKSTSERKLKVHLASTHANQRKNYLCSFCPRTYYNQGRLRAHELGHTNPMEFQCEKCPKRFNRRFKLAHHLLSHDKRSFQCHKCGATFFYKRNLDQHLRTIQCNRPGKGGKAPGSHFPCETCGFEARSVIGLKIHGLSHSSKGLNDFPCPEESCDKRCNTLLKLRGHWYSAHKNPRDGRAFRVRKKIEPPYICSNCGKEFTKSKYLWQHMHNTKCKIKAGTDSENVESFRADTA